ncbi:MAG TPA: hypothetical protein VFW96_00785 [Thermomicrobiales bacterium]|nr:hypothetical protein [Thermomicrobiales bacterium]
MDAEETGDVLALVVRLATAADGRSRVSVDGTATLPATPLPPATFTVRLWRARDTGLLRGSIRLHASERWGERTAPLQSDTRLEALARAWLLGEGGEA